jgi:hypothetical protein
MEGTTIYAAFEDDAAAERFSAVLRPTQSSRKSNWASRTLAQIDDVTYRRISAILKTAQVGEGQDGNGIRDQLAALL